MEMGRLGADGPEISRIGFGSWEAGGDQWGMNRSDDEVVAAMRSALDSGVNWIDTAEVYGQGRSEELVGNAVAGRRSEVLLFTKVAPKHEGSGLRPEEVHKAIRGSLSRLGTDHVDLYQVHWPDEDVPLEDTWGAMAELVAEGLTLRIGLSNFERPQIERCRSLHPVASVQNELSLLRREDRDSGLLAWLGEQGIGYLAYGPLCFGLLTGAIGEATTFVQGDWRAAQRAGTHDEEGPYSPGVFERNLELVRRLGAVAGRLALPLTDVALRWVLEQTGVTGAIVGTRDPEHARSNALVGDLSLQRDTVRELDDTVGS